MSEKEDNNLWTVTVRSYCRDKKIYLGHLVYTHGSRGRVGKVEMKMEMNLPSA